VEPRPLLFTAEQAVKTREDWENELIRRQDNIDPIRRIPNVALFHGTLIKGGQRWNRVQRAGALFLGGCTLAMGVAQVGWIVSAVRGQFGADPAMAIVALFFGPFTLWAGYRIVSNALFGHDQTQKLRPPR
jgi:hypothetical protein